jgi:hypothetical protein
LTSIRQKNRKKSGFVRPDELFVRSSPVRPDRFQLCSEAVPFVLRAVNIGQYSLPVDHPELQLYRKRLQSMEKNVRNNVFFF